MVRPKTEFNLPEGWQQTIIDLYSEGASDIEIKRLLHEWRGHFSTDLWNRWLEEVEEFANVIKTGRVISEGWWVKEGRTNLQNKVFNYVGWYMNMKNRFGWKDKTETELSGNSIKINVVPATKEPS